MVRCIRSITNRRAYLDQVRQWTEPDGPELIVEASGGPQAIQDAVKLARPGGKIVNISFCGVGEIPIAMDMVVAREISILGSIANPNSFLAALRLMEEGRLQVKDMITHQFDLADAVDAFEKIEFARHTLPESLAQAPEGLVKRISGMSAAKPRVLVNAPLSGDALEMLRQATEVVSVDQGDISDHIAGYQPLDGLIASAVLPVDGTLMDLFPGLKVIARLGIGVDNIALVAATKRGIAVVHTPEAPTISTAEHTVALIFALAKGITHQDRGIRDLGWSVRHEKVGRDLYGQCLGLLGFGRIAKRVVELLEPAGMRFMTYDPYVEPEVAQSKGVEWAPDLSSMLSSVDGLSLHAPLTDETYHIIGASELASMKEGGWLVNTSRGGLIDEFALVELLRTGHLSGAGLDVFDPEPPASDHPLMKMQNVVLTPHRAFYTLEGLQRLSQAAVSQVLVALRGQRPDHLANAEVWAHARARRGIER